jgi:hypothetical protein
VQNVFGHHTRACISLTNKTIFPVVYKPKSYRSSRSFTSCVLYMDYNIDKNRLIFTKIDKINPDHQFLRFTKNQLVTIKKIKFWFFKQKPEKPNDKPEKLVGLPFFIQILNFKLKTDRKPIDKLEKLLDFHFPKFQKLNFVSNNDRFSWFLVKPMMNNFCLHIDKWIPDFIEFFCIKAIQARPI